MLKPCKAPAFLPRFVIHAKDVDALEQRIKELCYAERYRDAESILRELLDRLREVTLPDEKRIMRTLHNLACVLFQQSKLVSVPAGNDSALDSAAAVLRTLLQMQVSLLGPGHEDVLETKRNLDEVQRTFDELPDMPLEEAEATAESTSDDAALSAKDVEATNGPPSPCPPRRYGIHRLLRRSRRCIGSSAATQLRKSSKERRCA